MRTAYQDPVNRRVGGLEGMRGQTLQRCRVNRRVGGLEELSRNRLQPLVR